MSNLIIFKTQDIINLVKAELLYLKGLRRRRRKN